MEEVFDLQKHMETKLMEELNQLESGNKIMVVDKIFSQMLGSYTSMDQLYEAGVILLENINVKRRTYPLDVVYAVEPTTSNIEMIIRDFTTTRRYQKVHILTSGKIGENELELLQQARVSVYIQTVRELNMKFLIRESRIFTRCEEPDKDELEQNAECIWSMCASLNLEPSVWSMEQLEPLGELVKEKMENHKKHDSKYAGNKNSEVVVFGRKIDMFAPLLHEFTYQAMVGDLVGINKNIAVTKTQKQVNMSERDSNFRKIRSEHIAECKTVLQKELNDFLRDNTAAVKGEKGEKQSVNEMKDTLASLPTYLKSKESFSAHFDLISECIEQFQELQLDKTGLLEQTLVTGFDENNKKTEISSTQVSTFLTDEAIPLVHRQRLALLFKITKPTLDLQSFNLSFVPNIDSITESISESQQLFLMSSKKTPTKFSNVFSRYKPNACQIVKNSFYASKTQKVFHCAIQQPLPTQSLRKSSRAVPSKTIIVFMSGGVTYSEIRDFFHVSRTTGANIVIGCDFIIDPNSFLPKLGAVL